MLRNDGNYNVILEGSHQKVRVGGSGIFVSNFFQNIMMEKRIQLLKTRECSEL